ncbi:hypothetical protein QTI24_06575 [Variovorax sp. J22P240]|uniref:hypothetical protein n=1 Tax=Variovorax sp. J22P240 TaxID=3053514 RepID=UPI002577B410|nr:hypothetical protein [Variovorax sp. J22P240]MDL9998260.1 hypothetical protein [Variovorax sp. J22P240]
MLCVDTPAYALTRATPRSLVPIHARRPRRVWWPDDDNDESLGQALRRKLREPPDESEAARRRRDELRRKAEELPDQPPVITPLCPVSTISLLHSEVQS